jgi:hypothetical protein
MGLLCLIPTFGHGGTIDMFPNREVAVDRKQIIVTIDNPSEQDIYCEYVNNFVEYRSRTTDNNISEMFPIKGFYIPGLMTRTFKIGAERTEQIRNSGIYPDAYIDVVHNDQLSYSSQCHYQKMPYEEKSRLLKEEASIENLTKLMRGNDRLQLQQAAKLPYVIDVAVEGDVVIIEGMKYTQGTSDTYPRFESRIHADGTVEYKKTDGGYLNLTPFTEAPSNSLDAKENLKFLIEKLSIMENQGAPGEGNSSIRDTLIGMFEKFLKAEGSGRKFIEHGFIYFRCASTTWNLDSKSRFRPLNDINKRMYLDIVVSEQWMTQMGDECSIISTPEMDNWNGSKAYFSSIEGPVASGKWYGLAAVAAEKKTKFVFPTKGLYRVILDTGNGHFSFEQYWEMVAPKGDGSIFKEPKTHAMWTRGELDSRKRSWEEAKHFCDTLIWDGKSNWTLPSLNELDSADRNGLTKLHKKLVGFGEVKDMEFWSRDEDEPNAAWGIMLGGNGSGPTDPAKKFGVLCIHY